MQARDMNGDQAITGQQPGEFSHYYVNLLTLFGHAVPVPQIEQWAHAAVASRDAEIARFADHLRALRVDFDHQTQLSGQRAANLPQPLLHGWEALGLEGLRQQHGGLLIALFHYGAHRQVFSDLAARQLPYIAPVAKQAYFDCAQLMSVAPPGFEAAMGLIEVEDPRVGRHMLQALRKGRIGVIYVDGNMGPDGHKVEEGGVQVDFLGRRIKVKAGVARLSHSLGLPVLPVSVRPDPGAPERLGQVVAGPLLLPADRGMGGDAAETSRIAMMQSIYDCLAAEVQLDPGGWEFAFCLHRWVVDAAAADAAQRAPLQLQPGQRLSVPRNQVALFERERQQFWVHVGKHKAFRLPAWADGLHAYLDTTEPVLEDAVHWLRQRQPDASQVNELLGGLHSRGLLAAA